MSQFFFSISHTTRTPRKNEENLDDYCFVTQEEFEQGLVMVRLCNIWFELTVKLFKIHTSPLHTPKNPPKVINVNAYS